MTETQLPKPNWTDADTEALFATIGRYVVIFQWAEAKLDQILLLGWGQEAWTSGQAKLAGMTNFEKVKATEELVLNSPDFAKIRTHHPEWCTEFESLIKRLHIERARRNSLVHSQYLFEFVDSGLGAPLRSNRRKQDGKSTFDQEHLTKAAQEKLLSDLGQLAMDVNFAYVQLIHAYQAKWPNP
jgi:hypothetical protein